MKWERIARLLFVLGAKAVSRFACHRSPRRFAIIGTNRSGRCSVGRGISGDELGQFLQQKRLASRTRLDQRWHATPVTLHDAKRLNMIVQGLASEVEQPGRSAHLLCHTQTL